MSHRCAIFNVLIVIIASLILCSDSSGQIKGYFPKKYDDSPDTLQDVSLIQLIAQPEKFEGKRVRFIGFLRIEFELSIRAAAFDTYGPTVRTLRQFLEAVHALAAYVRDLMLPNPDKKSADLRWAA